LSRSHRDRGVGCRRRCPIRAHRRARPCPHDRPEAHLRVQRVAMTRRMWWGVVVFILVWLVLYPNLYVLRDSFAAGNTFSLENYTRFLHSPSEMRALWNSVWISLASVALSAILGIPLAFFF